MKVKSSPVKFKTGAEAGLKDGEFLVYPSTFTLEPDSYGDVVAAGAFADGIKARKDAGVSLPGLFGHRMDDPDFCVAYAIDEGEDEHGWWVKGAFDLDSPKGPQMYRLVKSGRIRELSFAFDVLDEGQIELADGTKANQLRKLDVFEFSFVWVGANRDTSIVAVKTAVDALASGLQSGQTLSANHEAVLRKAAETLQAAAASIEDVLSQPGGDDNTADENAGGGGTGDDEGTNGVKSGDLDAPTPALNQWALEIRMRELAHIANS